MKWKKHSLGILVLLFIPIIFIGSGFNNSINKNSKLKNEEINNQILKSYSEIINESVMDNITKVSIGETNLGYVSKDHDGNEHLFTMGYGALGAGETVDSSLTPLPITGAINSSEVSTTLIPEGSAVTKLSMGTVISGAVIEDKNKNDHLYLWGKDSPIPKESNFLIPEGSKVTQLSTGNNVFKGPVFGFVVENIDDNGVPIDHLYINDSEITNTSDLSPLLLEGSKVAQFSIGADDFGVVIEDSKGNDHLYTWGKNIYGELGIEPKTEVMFPTEITDAFDSEEKPIPLIPEGSKMTKLSMGYFESSAVVEKGGKDIFLAWGFSDLFASNENWKPNKIVKSTPTVSPVQLAEDSRITYLSLGTAVSGIYNFDFAINFAIVEKPGNIYNIDIAFNPLCMWMPLISSLMNSENLENLYYDFKVWINLSSPHEILKVTVQPINQITSKSNPLLYITIGSVVGLILLIVIIVMSIIIHKKKKIKNN